MEIKLTKNKICIIDEEDYELVSQHKWLALLTPGGFYAARKAPKESRDKGGRYWIYLHKTLIQAGAGSVVDHINGDPLDNRRENLRVCSPGENSLNKKRYKSNTSGHQNVQWHNRDNRWQAQVRAPKGKRYSKYFVDFQEACDYADKLRKELHGEFARQIDRNENS